MSADTQSIAVLMTVSSILMKLITPPMARRMMVRTMKKVKEALSAVRYVLGCILRGRIIFEINVRMRIYPMNIPIVRARRIEGSMPDMKAGAYSPNLSATRQKGRTMAIASISLSRLCLTLDSRFTLSFHLMVQAISDGNMFTNLPSRRMAVSAEINARMSNSISIASFCSVSHIFKKGCHPVAEISLDGDLSVFCAPADSALHLEGASKFGKVI